MTSFVMKLFVCPIGIIIAAWLLPNVDYGAYYQPITVGIILAVVGTLMEYLLLKRGTLWTSTVTDFVVTVLLVYFISNLFTDARVTFFGSILIGVLLGVVEYFTHLWLIRNGKTRKSPA